MTAGLPRQNLHASCVALAGRAVLIMGASGAGKSALALHLIALGAVLVADDRTDLSATPEGLIASCPPALCGLIEARGVGLLRATTVPQARVVLAVDLDRPEPDRLPPRRHVTILGQDIDLVLRSQNDHFPSAVLVYLMGGRAA